MRRTRKTWTLVVPLRDGRVRKYRSTSERAAHKRLADHNAMVGALGMDAHYLTAYLIAPDGREFYVTA